MKLYSYVLNPIAINATVFENVNQDRFMGIISGVSSNGQLEILLEDDTTKQFGLKEITMIY